MVSVRKMSINLFYSMLSRFLLCVNLFSSSMASFPGHDTTISLFYPIKLAGFMSMRVYENNKGGPFYIFYVTLTNYKLFSTRCKIARRFSRFGPHRPIFIEAEE